MFFKRFYLVGEFIKKVANLYFYLVLEFVLSIDEKLQKKLTFFCC